MSQGEDAANRRARDLRALEDSGVFDAAWYAAANADVSHSGQDPAEHYIDLGWKEGRAPNFYLDPAWYIAHNADVREAGIDPVLHYIMHGDAEGRTAGPHFDAGWYRGAQGLAAQDRALPHYLRERQNGATPLGEFDAGFYLATYRDVARAGADAFEHYVTIGWQEGREPHPYFDSRYYVKAHMGGTAQEAPLLHWLAHRHEPGVHPRMPHETPTIPREFRRNTRPAEEFELPQPLPEGAVPRAKVLAYYLPQFHPIAENDAWWGTGFTEWTNLARALPRFAGHYQPRIPRDLGHYSLAGPDAGAAVMRRQIAMAKGGGVHGFIFYWYWFNGHRLLEKPVDAFLADQTLDMPFALMWANENWTRRWDGAEADVLMSQDYRPEEEAALMQSLARHFADPRYIRVQGRPVLMMYRAGLMPEPKKTIEGWRRRFRENHDEDPVFVMAQSFDDSDPGEVGFDGAIEFPPHKLARRTTPISAHLDYLDPDFNGTVFSFDDVVRASLEEPAPDFPLIKCAIPGWDNDPRKQGNGTVVIHGAKPASYQAWMAELVDRAVRTPFFGEPLVCVNAWNEWCEGAYLEPDLHYGAAFLNANARAVIGAQPAEGPALLVAATDAEDTEATTRLIQAVRGLRQLTGLRVEVLLLAGGPREEEFARLGPVTVTATALEAALDAARLSGVRHTLITSAAATSLAAAAAVRGFAITVMAQEMPGELRARHALGGLRGALRHADRLLVPSEAVALALAAEFKLPTKVTVVEPGLDGLAPHDPAARRALRAELNLAEGDRLLLGAGPGDLRHGFDLFLQLFRRLRQQEPKLRAIWVGTPDASLRGWLAGEIAGLGRQGLRVVEHLAEPGALLSAADVLALTAREAPFPTLAQQAVAAGLSVVTFEGAGGAAALLASFTGRAVPMGDIEAMAEATLALLKAPPPEAAREIAYATARRRFDPRHAAAALLGAVLPNLPDIAVVVPGRGQGGLLASRLDGVFRQDLPVREVVLLDDPGDAKVAAGATLAARRWHRLVHIMPGPGSGPNCGTAAAMAEAALAATTAGLIWLAQTDHAPSGIFLRRAAAALAATPAAPFAAAGKAPILAGVLWRRAALMAALSATGTAVDGPALCQAAAKLGAPVLLLDVPLLALAPAPRPSPAPPEPAPSPPASAPRGSLRPAGAPRGAEPRRKK